MPKSSHGFIYSGSMFEKGKSKQNGNERFRIYVVLSVRLSHTLLRTKCRSYFFADANDKNHAAAHAVLGAVLCIFISESHSNEVQFMMRFQLEHTIAKKE